MTTVRQILKEKEREFWSVHPDHSIVDAMKVMMERDIGSLPVIADARLLGIVTERQFARSVLPIASHWRVLPCRKSWNRRFRVWTLIMRLKNAWRS